MKFEEKLIIQRKRLGFSQEELAARIGVSRQAVSRWELGSTMPDAPNLVKLADLFGVTTDYLLRENQTDEPYSPTPAETKPGAPEAEPLQAQPKDEKKSGRFLFSGCCYLFAAFCFFIAASIQGNEISYMSLAAGVLQLVAGCGMLANYRKLKK
ncbi:MAG: helix-turn-helix transcriptional regulator [Oscillospiraceae bacterium]|nr:helix-turn-helix transcriptional regulator [Oscillospiraceae bacterium]